MTKWFSGIYDEDIEGEVLWKRLIVFLKKDFPDNKLRYNYVFFFIIFWLQTNVTKKQTFYNVISIRNSNVPKYSVILTLSQNVITSNKQHNCDVIKNTLQWRTKTKRNCNVISIRNSNIPKYSVILTSLKNVATSNKQIT